MTKSVPPMTVAMCATTARLHGALLGASNFTGGESSVPSAAGLTFGAFSRQDVGATTA